MKYHRAPPFYAFSEIEVRRRVFMAGWSQSRIFAVRTVGVETTIGEDHERWVRLALEAIAQAVRDGAIDLKIRQESPTSRSSGHIEISATFLVQ